MTQALVSSRIEIAGMVIRGNVTRTAEGQQTVEVVVPAGQAGSLSTRTDDDTGIITLDATPVGITDADTMDIYWDGGQRRNVAVDAVAGNNIAFGAANDGDGDVMPAQDTAVVIGVQKAFNLPLAGGDIAVFAAGIEHPASSASRSRLTLLTSGDVVALTQDLYAESAEVRDIAAGAADPLGGATITDGTVSTESIAAAPTLKIAVLKDATP